MFLLKSPNPNMVDPTTQNGRLIQEAFLTNERVIRVQNFRVACILAFIFMPAGCILDWLKYPDYFGEFLKLRLFCSALLLFIWWFVTTAIGARMYRLLGLTLPFLPTFFISVMILRAQDPVSPYYAGLNLVLLGASLILRWTLIDSMIVFLEVIVCFLGACFLLGAVINKSTFFNNLYFLSVTGAFVLIGSYFYNRLRFREFALRYELDAEKKKTEQRNRELADAYQKLTEQESQIVQSQKMASVGQMSAGIIHEINNPLNFATTGLFTLRKKSKHLPAEQRAEYDDIVKDIEDGIGRVKNIVSDLRTFTHPNTDILDQVVVSDVVASALRFLSNEVKDKAVIEQKLPVGQTVLANKNKLIHLFVNLIQNSLDALRTKSFPNGEQPTIWIEGRVENGASYLVVRDNGSGIPIDQVDKIYDPFFTTKAVGEGMGLGLSMCARIMKDSQGKISVRTEKDKFCEFTLEFPEPT